MRSELASLMPTCVLVAQQVRGTTVSGSAMKSVLWILAAFEGRPISQRAVALYAGVVDPTAARAIEALQKVGAVVQHVAAGGRAVAYSVDAEFLARNQASEPPVFAHSWGANRGLAPGTESAYRTDDPGERG